MMPATVVRNRLTAMKNKARREGWLRQIKSEADERAMLAGCTFSKKRAEHVVNFFRQFLRHSKGQWAGKPFELFDWQRDDLIFPLFGWLRANGFRRYSKAYVEIPKKNGKSSIASAIGLYMLAGDDEPGAEIYSVASDRGQAGIVHKEAILMVDSSPELSAALDVNRSSFNIAYPETKSFYRALAAVATSQEGLNAHAIIADELHVWYGRASWDALKYAGRARRQPLTFAITTAGDDVTSVCREQHDYAKAVAAGTIEDERFFGYIRAAEPADDWTDPEVWKKANPSLGEIIRIEDFAADFREAQQTPTAQASFKRYSLNVWTTSTNPWLDIHRWNACAVPFTEADLAGRECYGAFDLAMKVDTTALALLFPWDKKPDGGKTYRLLMYFWQLQETAERQRNIIPWHAWEQRGHITLTDGSVSDFPLIRRSIQEITKRFKVKGLAFDRQFATVLAQALQDEDGIAVTEFPQTIMAFAAPTAMFERLVIAGDIRHNDNKVMNWQIGNTNVRCDVNNNIRPVKPPDGEHRKIDGPVAAIMALGLAMEAKDDVYEFVPGTLRL